MTDPRPKREAGLRIVDLVFGRTPPARRSHLVVAGAVALGLHAVLAFSTVMHARSRPAVAPVVRDQTIELAESSPPPPAPEPTPPQAPTPLAPARRAAPAPRAAQAKPALPPPAQAGRIIAQEPDPADPVDLGDQGFVTGTGQIYAGGTTSSSGTSRTAVTSAAVDPKAQTGLANAVDRSAAVALTDQSWACPWPREADDQDLAVDEQVVVVRVVVRADGTAVGARAVTDPGLGFGAAAVACARSARYLPARDAEGKVTQATSPPIRVRFTR